MFHGAVLKIVEEAGVGVLTLTEGVEKQEFLRSRLTRSEVTRHLLVMSNSLSGLGATLQESVPEVDWQGWKAVGRLFTTPGPEQEDALWFAIQALVPATLMWLRVYRQSQPALFAFTPY